MKRILIILSVFTSTLCFSQTKVVIGEYQQGYITSDGRVYTPVVTGYDYRVTMSLVNNMDSIVDGDGAQYTTIYRDTAGKVFVLQGQSIKVTNYFLKDDGSQINATRINGLHKSYFAIENGEVYYLCPQVDELNQNHGVIINEWKKLKQPSGNRTITKITSGLTSDVYSIMMALCSDGTVWEYTRNSTTPVKLSFKGIAVDIAQISANAQIIITSSNKILVKGFYASYVEGGINGSTTFSDVTNFFTSKGVTYPLKMIKGTSNSVHLIDANNNLYGSGGNMEGMLGTGDQYPSWRTYRSFGARKPYQWSWQSGDRNTGVVQVPGKFKNIVTHNALTYYVYAQDMGENWYSWGRNKASALGNGVHMKNNDEAYYYDYLNIPAPRKVTPLIASWSYIPNVDTATLRTPIASAGVDQYLINETSTTLYGQGSHQQQPTAKTTIKLTNEWTKISGPDCIIVNSNYINTKVTNLTKGIYVFRNTVTSSHGKDYQDIIVNVEF
ncbi:MAG: hypothetical protein ABIP68_03910 [Ferruginibacter sp.]